MRQSTAALPVGSGDVHALFSERVGASSAADGVVRFPFAALEDALVASLGPDPSDRAVARAIGVQSQQVPRLRGGINAVQADRYATAAGFHPSQVWGELWWASADEDECPCGEPLPMEVSKWWLCLDCRERARQWEISRNKSLQRRFWRRLDGYRDSMFVIMLEAA